MPPVIPIVANLAVSAIGSTAISGFASSLFAGSRSYDQGIDPNRWRIPEPPEFNPFPPPENPDRNFRFVAEYVETDRTGLRVAAQPGGPQIGLFGRRRVGGRIIFAGYSEDEGSYHLIIAIAGAPCDAVEAVYVDNQRVIFDTDGVTVLTPPWINASLRVDLFTGAQTTAAQRMKDEFPNWTDDYRGELQTYAHVEIVEANEPDAFANGVPDFSFDVRGFKCYDPRNVDHDIADPATWEFTENPALFSANYLIHPLGHNLPTNRVDWESVADAASVCDESVARKDGGVEARYTGAIRWTCDERHEDVLNAIGAAMAGGTYLVGREYRVKAGRFDPATATITPNDYEAGGLSWSETPSISSRPNGVRGTFASELHANEPRDFPSYQDATALTDDADVESWLDLDFRCVTSPTQAQRLARIAYNKARSGFPARVELQFTHFDTVANDVVAITDAFAGFDEETFRVVSEKVQPGFVISLELEHETAAFYTWDAATDEQDFSAAASVYATGGDTGVSGNTETTGTALGDEGALVPGGGAFADGTGGDSWNARVQVWDSPNINPNAVYRARVVMQATIRKYREYYSTGGSPPVTTLVSTVLLSTTNPTETYEQLSSGADIVFPQVWTYHAPANQELIQTDAAVNYAPNAFYIDKYYRHSERVRDIWIRSERNGEVSPWQVLFSSASGSNVIAANLQISSFASSVFYAPATPCAPYVTAFSGGTVDFNTNVVDGGALVSHIEFASFPNTTTNTPTSFATVANDGSTLQRSNTPGNFEYIRCRTVMANGKVSPWSNYLLVVY